MIPLLLVPVLLFFGMIELVLCAVEWLKEQLSK